MCLGEIELHIKEKLLTIISYVFILNSSAQTRPIAPFTNMV